MTIKDIDVTKSIDDAREFLKSSKNLSPEARALMELLVLIVSLLAGKLQTNSSNSSIPPSKDPLNSNKKSTKNKKKAKGKKKKPGAQNGHKGSCLDQVDNPDEVQVIEIDRRTIPGGDYHSAGFEVRQVFDVRISTHVTEYRAEVLVDEDGNRYVAEFPDSVKNHTQYGTSVKAQSVYMSIWQLVPLLRVAEFFNSQFEMPISKGSVSNFNQLAYDLLEPFEIWAKRNLKHAALNHADETGINIGGKRHWLHCLSNEKVALFHADEKRGTEAMNRMGVLADFKGLLIHDHWKPYYTFDCIHCLCNAHHLRELTWSFEVDGKKWAGKMKELLLAMNEATKKAGGKLSEEDFKKFLRKYRSILRAGKKECPFEPKDPGKRGKPKQTKSRNLLDRLVEYESDVLRFAVEKIVPFTNNPGENDIRMTKVQQKVSGCFRSLKGAQIFCRVRSFLLTCQKQGLNPFDCLINLFSGQLPEFMN